MKLLERIGIEKIDRTNDGFGRILYDVVIVPGGALTQAVKDRGAANNIKEFFQNPFGNIIIYGCSGMLDAFKTNLLASALAFEAAYYGALAGTYFN